MVRGHAVIQPENDCPNEWIGDTEPPDGFSGVWVRHYPDGGRREIEYRAGAANGIVRQWDRDGRLGLEGHVESGLWHGPLTRWVGDGEVQVVSHFVHGSGTYQIFSSSGKLVKEIELVAGRRHGVTRRWNGRGELVGIEHYQDGVMVSREDR
jgi:antitoxin component YwqK of YwqJK toxin-antitoxin module